jgi:hypothetical protein
MTGRDRALQNVFLITGITGGMFAAAGFLSSMLFASTGILALNKWTNLYAALAAFAAEMWREDRKGMAGLMAVSFASTALMQANYQAGYVGEWFYWTAGTTLTACLIAFFIGLSRLKDLFRYAPGGPFTTQ